MRIMAKNNLFLTYVNVKNQPQNPTLVQLQQFTTTLEMTGTPTFSLGQARAIVSEVPDDVGDPYTILLDSGGDAAVSPSTFAGCGTETNEQSARMHDAQGCEIPGKPLRM